MIILYILIGAALGIIPMLFIIKWKTKEKDIKNNLEIEANREVLAALQQKISNLSKLEQNSQSNLNHIQEDTINASQILSNLRRACDEAQSAYQIANDNVVELKAQEQNLLTQQDYLLASIALNQTELEAQLNTSHAIWSQLSRTNEKIYGIEWDPANESEMELIRRILPHVRTPLLLCKAIWEMYYKEPLKEMINKAGVAGLSGIYKITVVEGGNNSSTYIGDTAERIADMNEHIYIGKSVDIGRRWIEHCKRGIGIEAGTTGGEKLYKKMNQCGIENCKFEVVEEVPDAGRLNERERYWINWYASNKCGLNVK